MPPCISLETIPDAISYPGYTKFLAMATLRSHYDYTVGWICALPKEQTAAMLVLDTEHPDLFTPPGDKNVYTLGSIGPYNVAITCLPISCYGTNQMAATATYMVGTFPSIKITLMVGIGAGVPSKVKLGDVVISTEWIQWDFGKASRDFELSSRHYYPPKELSAAMSKLKSQQNRYGTRIPQYLEKIKANNLDLSPEFVSVPGNEVAADPRKARVHYGLIASGNQVVKNAQKRDEISRLLKNRVLCIEMEAAGLVDCPAVIVRGICDYADEAKNDDWQEYAAVLAAICARELLQCVQPNHINSARPISDNIQHGPGMGLEQGHYGVVSFLSGINIGETSQRRDINSHPIPNYYNMKNDSSNTSGPETIAKSQNQHPAKEPPLPQKITNQDEKDNRREGNFSPGIQKGHKASNPPKGQGRDESKISPQVSKAGITTSSHEGPDIVRNKLPNRRQPESSDSDWSDLESQSETEELKLRPLSEMFKITADQSEEKHTPIANLPKRQNWYETRKLPYSSEATSNKHAKKLDALKNRFPDKRQSETSTSNSQEDGNQLETEESTLFGDLFETAAVEHEEGSASTTSLPKNQNRSGVKKLPYSPEVTSKRHAKKLKARDSTLFGDLFETAAVEHEESSTPAPTPEPRDTKERNITQQNNISDRNKQEAPAARWGEMKPYEWPVIPSQYKNKTKQSPETGNKKPKASVQQNNDPDRKQRSTFDERLSDRLKYSPGITYAGDRDSTGGNEPPKSRETPTGGRLSNPPKHRNQGGMNELPFYTGISDDETQEKPQKRGLSKRMESLKIREPVIIKRISDSPKAPNKRETKQSPSSERITSSDDEKAKKGARKRSKRDRTVLSIAVEAGSIKEVRYLLDRGADLEAEDEHTGYTPLAWAGKMKNYEIINLLLQRGAKVELESQLSRYLLKVAGGKEDGDSMYRRALDGEGEFSLQNGMGAVKRDIMVGMIVWARRTTQFEVLAFLRKNDPKPESQGGLKQVATKEIKRARVTPNFSGRHSFLDRN
ncbi:hypothetical protein TWF718_007945 [Orbilia javanica]|uniref:Nucleoside phosphorylase domain-containing protein n=1 Tax=Orbilia javanica TaxID=47235 RepID=A0AAN8MQ22_9PEZI